MDINPFKYDQPKEKFNNTFLKVVTLKLEYDKTNETYESFSKFFNLYTELTLTEDRYKAKNLVSIALRAEEGNVILKFEGNRIEFIIGNGIYKSYPENLEDFVKKFAKFLQEINANVNDITITKLNEWVFENNETFSKDRAFELIYSSKLRHAVPLNEDDFAIKVYDLDEEGKAVVRYGVLNQEEDVQHKTFVLETSVVSDVLVTGNELEKKCKELNQTLYNMFLWSVTDLVIDVMKS